MAKIAKRYQVDPLIRQTSARIVRSCPPKDDLCEVGTLQNWVRSNIRYTGDVLDVETVQTPDYTLTEGYGDCDDQSVLLATLLMSIGHPAAFCAVGIAGGPFSHVLPVAILRQHTQVLYVPCETTISKDENGTPVGPGWFPPDVSCMKLWHI